MEIGWMCGACEESDEPLQTKNRFELLCVMRNGNYSSNELIYRWKFFVKLVNSGSNIFLIRICVHSHSLFHFD